MWGDHFLASLRRLHHISTAVRTRLAFLFRHLPRNDTISRILWMRNRRHIFLYRRVCCKCSFCQHRSGFCNYSTDRLKSWIWVNSMFYIFSFIRKIKEKNYFIYNTHFEITDGPCNLIGSNWCDLFTNRTIFCSKSNFFSSQWGSNVKSKTTNQISRLKMLHSLQKNERQRVANCGKFCNFCFQNSYFFPSKNRWP